MGAITGVLTRTDYRAGLERAGLTGVTITPTTRVAADVDSAIIQARRR